jgi:chemotaxis protein MotB
MTRLLPCLVVLQLACVTQGTYDALLADRNATQEKLTQKEREAQELKGGLDQEKAKSASLGTQIEKLQSDVANMLKDKSALQSNVDEMRRALAELQKRKADADSRIAEFRNLLQRFKGLIDSGKLKVKIVEGRMVVQLATDVLFPSGSANLSKEGQMAIAEVAGVLASIPDRKFQVEGHTDNVPIRTAQYKSNWELAAGRAINVVRAMTDAGMPADRISAASFGEAKPVAPNDSEEGKRSNRRIEIVVVPDLSGLPGFDELNRLSPSAAATPAADPGQG